MHKNTQTRRLATALEKGELGLITILRAIRWSSGCSLQEALDHLEGALLNIKALNKARDKNLPTPCTQRIKTGG